MSLINCSGSKARTKWDSGSNDPVPDVYLPELTLQYSTSCFLNPDFQTKEWNPDSDPVLKSSLLTTSAFKSLTKKKPAANSGIPNTLSDSKLSPISARYASQPRNRPYYRNMETEYRYSQAPAYFHSSSFFMAQAYACPTKNYTCGPTAQTSNSGAGPRAFQTHSRGAIG
ncbi:hypothetical protein K432DRAFT_454325 [Lepidopterella palustris CBS 459.81]|uniref:Uncharacterized protein n=1 Tax=Lepidopterella palustris CBS 459.81 TaxID=1314670 RepID=A0A8E2E985_9PEZI|nr:hypothetical protein K432DRAFT_454325 [Lepidopterella palustris CBS 459.81]